MTTRISRATVVLGLATMTLVAGTATARGQHGHGGDHGTQGASHAGHLSAQRCAEEFDAVIADGRGFGMAFAADQHGYPGPLHVLELKDRLRLTAEQEHRMRGLMEGMFARSRPASGRLLDAERRLVALFAAGSADEAAVRTAVADVEHARTAVRLVHLLTHLGTRDLLTAEQRAEYHRARWGR